MLRVGIAIVVAAIGACRYEGASSDHGGFAPIVLVARAEDAPSWAVRYGEEFWRRDSVEGIDIGDVIERVSWAVQKTGDDPPRAVTRRYTATFDGSGLRLSPNRPDRAISRTGPAVESIGSGPDPSTEFRLRALRVSSGARELYRIDDRIVPWSMLGNTAQALLAAESGVVEHYETTADGVEVSWVVPDRAVLGDDLTIEVTLGGLAYAGSSERGAHFADSSGIARVLIGQAELVDASGRRWPVSTEIIDGGARWRATAEIISQANFPIALDPIVGPEFGIDQPIGPAAGTQFQPSIAWNGAGYLVVWEDNRNGLYDIYATRVSSTGVVQDPAGILVSGATGDQANASVAWNGTSYFIAWTDGRGTDYDVYGARVSAAGAVQDSGGIAISTASNDQGEICVASDGSNFFVAWSDGRGTAFDIFGARVSGTGAVQDPTGIPISTATSDQRIPSVTWDGANYFVVWGDRRNGNVDAYGARVSAAGAVQDANGIAISTALGNQPPLAITYNGADHLVVWHDTRNGNADVYGARVSPTGVVHDPAGIAIATGASTQWFPRAASNGSDWFVAWDDNAVGVVGARVSAAGAVLDLSAVVIAPSGRGASIVSNGTDYMIVWSDERTFGHNIFGARVSSTASVQDPAGILISSGPPAQSEPALAWDGASYLVVWQDYRNALPSDIYAARLSAAGSLLDPNGIAIAVANGFQGDPSVAWNGVNYMIAWQDSRNGTSDIYGARLTAAGAVLDTTGIPISTATDIQGQPGVAWDGTNFLVAWSDSRNGTSDVYAARVSAAGAVLEPNGIAVSTASNSQAVPSVAWSGTTYLVAWYDTRNQTTAGYDIYGSRMSPAGVVEDPNGIAISSAAGNQLRPSIAWNGTSFLVVWEDDRTANFVDDIYAARVSESGVVQDPTGIPISTGVEDQTSARVAWDGVSSLVVWRDRRSGSNYDIYGARVATSGAVQDPNGFVISAAPTDEDSPALVASAVNRYLVAYERSYEVLRARLITNCGNGVIDPGETCDDGGALTGDGCSAVCIIENGYTCSGTPSTCFDVDECAAGSDNCDVNATCANTPGSFTCTCNPPYSGNGVTCDVDECTAGTDNCDVNATCTNTPGSFMCACDLGYTGNGLVCTDVDECSAGTDNCDANATCSNTTGSFGCTCNAGYVGNGVACSDVDECIADADNCDANAMCTNTNGGFSCSCKTGYTGDGTACTDVDECTAGTHDCNANATCSNTNGGFECACNAGYTGDGVTCTETDAPPAEGCGCKASSPQASALLLALVICLLLVLRRHRAPIRSRECA